MASTDAANLSGNSATVDGVKESGEKSVSESLKASLADISVDKLEAHGADASPQSLSPGSSSTPLGAVSTTNGTTNASGHASILAAPHPKKFTSSTINKKFLEKASSTPSLVQSSASSSAKLGSSVQKPALQAMVSHSRLVTAKLTATPQPSPTTGPGWSRPSSAVPPAASAPPSIAQKPVSPAGIAQIPGAPQPAPLGKVIQPQPRPSDLASSISKVAGKSAWGNTNLSAVVAAVKLDAVAADFPTAAEVAQGKVALSLAKAESEGIAEAQKQASTAEADTFRGVHLDPNAHHWDEIEEDDNFLSGVIEFDDGRQYKIQPTDSGKSSPPHALRELGAGEDTTPAWQAGSRPPDQPVSKEERFADDFDRSWPRNSLHTNFSAAAREQFGSGLASASSSHSHQSQQESKVLFNERSNKLEPWSQTQTGPRYNGPGGPSYMARRGSRSDHGVSPEPRFTRDLPPHRPVQLLQKSTDHRPIGDQLGRTPFPRERETPRRDTTHAISNGMQRTFSQRSQGQMGSPSWASPTSFSRPPGPFSRDGPPEGRPGRSPTAPVERSLTEEIPQDSGRQLPPHLSDVRRQQRSPALTASPLESGAPAASHAGTLEDIRSPESQMSLLLPAPGVPSKSSLEEKLPLPDLEKVQKAAMHDAVERARLRRQQEEEEREKERERARKKAEEIKERLSAVKQAQIPSPQQVPDAQAETVKIIEDAIQEARTITSVPLSDPGTSEGTPSRSVAAEASPRLPRADSWRSRAVVAGNASDVSAISAPSPLADMSDLVNPDETLEIVDFSEMGKLVGVEKSSKPQHTIARPDAPARNRRPVASDFFDITAAPARVQVPPEEVGSWRRRPMPPPQESLPETTAAEGGVTNKPPTVHVHEPPVVNSDAPERHGDEAGRHTIATHLPPHASSRSPVTQTYRQAPMSTLDDTMMRIKGALAGMHTEPEAIKPTKWLPPALRPRLPEHMPTPTEVFDKTGIEPPTSPKPAWNNFIVRLPQSSTPALPVSEKQLRLSRIDLLVQRNVYCWHTPMYSNWAKQDPTFAELLFGRPHMVRCHPRYRVSLPRVQRLQDEGLRAKPQVSGPVVNLPSRTARASVDEASSSSHTPLIPPPMLDTTSRSPPPDDSARTIAGHSLAKTDDATPAVNGIASKAKTQPKLPLGSDVFFYRSSEECTHKPAKTVSFIMTSELEDDTVPTDKQTPEQAASSNKSSGKVNGERTTQSGASNEAEVIVGEEVTPESMVRVGTPPQSQINAWIKSPGNYPIKDSPSRPPDPEHLKAVWSHASDKATLPSTNSLEGIGDDLTTVPFTLQEVKSEDGGTPPPSGSGPPSRMSLHDVTKAFQQVPSPPGSAGHRVAALPSLTTSTNGMAPRPPSYPYPQAASNMRPAYPAYPSPLLSSPSPTMMYPPQMVPSPVPRPMVVNGGSSPYMQPVWIPSTPAGVVRPLASPYHPSHLVPYPSPGGAVPVYGPPPPGMQNGSPQTSGVPNRSASMGMTSPVMSQPHALYAGSPVLMHSMPAGPYPGTMTPGRPQPRNAYDPHAQPMSMMPPSMSNVPRPPYPAVPLNPYAPRPSW